MFFHHKDSNGKTTRGDAFEECEKYRPSPLSGTWQKILLKQLAEKLIIALHTILNHQEVRPSALGDVPPFWQKMFLTGTLMEKFRQGNWACRADLPQQQRKLNLLTHGTTYSSCAWKQETNQKSPLTVSDTH
jgi:hypothetical protein